MGVIIRQSIQNTVLSYIGVVLGFVTTILLFPRILMQDQYGLTRLLVSVTLISTQFAHLGMKNVIIRFYPWFREEKGKLLFLAFAVPLVGFLIFCALFFLFQDQLAAHFSDENDLFADYALFLLPLIFSVLFFEVLNSYVRSLKDSTTGSFLNEVLLRVLIILLLVIYYLNWIDFPVFMIGFVAAYAVQPVCLVAYLILRGEPFPKIPFRRKGRRLARAMGVYGLYSLLGGLATVVVGNIDIVMLSAMTDLENTAVYAIAFYVGSVIAIPQRSIGKIAVPILSGYLKEGKLDQVESLYRRTSLNQVIAGSLLLTGIWANMHNLIDLLPPEYAGVKWVIVVVGFARLFDMATGINGSIILNSRHYRFDLWSNIFLVLLTIFTNWLLIPLYGILGAGIATAFSIFLYNLIKYIFVWITFSMQPFRWNTLYILLAALFCLWVSDQIPYWYNAAVDIAVRSAAITILFFGIILMFGLSDDIRLLAKSAVERIRKRGEI